MLGVRAGTGAPIGNLGYVPSPMNTWGIFGKGNRIFATAVNLQGETDREFILGYESRDSKMLYRIASDVIEKAKPYDTNLWIATFKGSGAANANVTLSDQAGSPVATLKLQAAYKDKLSYGTYDNNYAVVVKNVVRVSTTIKTVSGSNPTSIVVNSTAGIKVGDEIKMVRSSTPYGFTVSAIDESTNTLTGVSETGTPAMQVGDVVSVMNFKLTAYYKNVRGVMLKCDTSFNDNYLSMNSTSEYYAVNVLKNHPVFNGVNMSSATGFYKAFPSDTASGSYTFLASGSDGTAPSSVSDWNTLQTLFDNIRLVGIIGCDTTDANVHTDWLSYVNGRRSTDFPIYVPQMTDFGSDYSSLKAYTAPFVKSVDWQRILFLYGQRYISDSNGDLKKISVHGGVVGKWINVIYSGQAQHSPAEYQYTLTYLTGTEPIYEDTWNDSIRTTLYDAGCNIVQYVQGTGILVRNFRTPSNDLRTRDAHKFIIDQIIKFTVEDNEKTQENKPAKYQTLDQIKGRIEINVLKPMYEGSLSPYILKADQSDSGAFADFKADGSAATSYRDVSRVSDTRATNTVNMLALGQGVFYIDYASYSLLNEIQFWTRIGISI